METFQNLLCIRADNFGDLLMSSPAIRAIKESFACKITILTSSSGNVVVPLIEEIDECIVFDLPWVKLEENGNEKGILDLVEELSKRNFDACIVFNTFSQNTLPAALIAWMAKIPVRIGYCRENPYNLLNRWLPDKEPYQKIVHQVERDLQLAEYAGARISDKRIRITIPEKTTRYMGNLLSDKFLKKGNYLVIHVGVTEEKRKYPLVKWLSVCQQLIDRYHYPLVFSGTVEEKAEITWIKNRLKGEVHHFAGKLSLAETAALINHAKALISVNTGIVHLAASLLVPIVVLYAQTNPQHVPWMTKYKLLEYSVPPNLESKNEVIKWLSGRLYNFTAQPTAEDVCKAFMELKENLQYY